MLATNGYYVRPARQEDLHVLAELEEKIWKPLGMPAISHAKLSRWHTEDSPYFLVAECESEVCGYFFGRQISFSMKDIPRFVGRFPLPTKGFRMREHDPSGNAVYGMTIISSRPGVGNLLYTSAFELFREHHVEFYVGHSRLPGLSRYVQEVEMNSRANPDLDTIALWYVHENARRLHMKPLPECAPKPNVHLPPLTRTDPVLAFHARGRTFSLAGILPEYVLDPESRNYGAFIISEFPHNS